MPESTHSISRLSFFNYRYLVSLIASYHHFLLYLRIAVLVCSKSITDNCCIVTPDYSGNIFLGKQMKLS
jgi:hypothetical protein